MNEWIKFMMVNKSGEKNNWRRLNLVRNCFGWLDGMDGLDEKMD